VCKAVAATFQIGYIESGRTYRIVAYQALQEQVQLTDEPMLAALCDRLLENGILDLYETDSATSKALRMPDVSRAVSLVAKLPAIRTRVTGLTRELVALTGPSIVEGRDIGTTVFPDAVPKIFLTASPEVRATRRSQDEPTRSYARILDEIERRDAIDSARKHSPLVPADGATFIDTSSLTVDQVITRVVHHCRQAGVTRVPHPANASRR
jgi:cytidylate kinase